MKHVSEHRRVRLPVLGHVRTWVAAVGAVVGLLLAVLVILLIPLIEAHVEAKRAETALSAANHDMATQQFGTARTSLADARAHVDSAQTHVNGWVADLWTHLPVLGPAVTDGRHLVTALDQATRAATIGVDVITRATAPGSTLVEGNRVDIAELRSLTAQAHRIGPPLRAARRQIALVRGDEPLVGGKITSLKHKADAQLATTEKSYHQFRPLVNALPSVLGATGPRTYLITIMNPSEQRFSGGATLQMATIRFDRGTIEFGSSQSVAEVDQAQPFLDWPPVPGNIFHRPGPTRLTAATFSPWWQVSGEELLRAWQAQTGVRCQGLIAVDLQALAELFRITGPMQVQGYGQIDADNLVKVLAGSYDSYQDPYQRRRLNNALVPAFQQKFLGGGEFVQKGQSLLDDARGRHVALYFRDPRVQRAASDAGLSGNLSTTRYDYMGVFSQNLNGSKSDYWQTRHVSSEVTLRPDGSASESLGIQVENPAPPYTLSTPDPRSGYDTRWLGTILGIFLPQGTRLDTVTVDGRTLPHARLEQPGVEERGIRNRPVLRHVWMLAPQATGSLSATYTVPHAASVDPATGDMVYRVHLDPQDLVRPQTNAITLHAPSGYGFGPLPHGWVLKDPSTAVLWVPQLLRSSSWQVPVTKN